MSISSYIIIFLFQTLFFFHLENEPGLTISYSKRDKYPFRRATLFGEIGLFIEITIQKLGKNNLDSFAP
jgi:hypothetical protein